MTHVHDEVEQRRAERFPRVVAYLRMTVPETTMNDTACHDEDFRMNQVDTTRLPARNMTSKESEILVEALKGALDVRSRALSDDLARRHEQRPRNGGAERTETTKDVLKSGIDMDANDPEVSDNTQNNDTREASHLSAQDFIMEQQSPGNLLLDLTSLSMISALLSPFLEESNIVDTMRMKLSERGHDRMCFADFENKPPECTAESPCPLQALSASTVEWWDRPPWAWTWKEIMLAHGVMIAHDLCESLRLDPSVCPPSAIWHVSVSSTAFLAQLPVLHGQHEPCCNGLPVGLPILIQPDKDAHVISRLTDAQNTVPTE